MRKQGKNSAVQALRDAERRILSRGEEVLCIPWNLYLCAALRGNFLRGGPISSGKQTERQDLVPLLSFLLQKGEEKAGGLPWNHEDFFPSHCIPCVLG